MKKDKRINNIGFISTRFAGTDGVSMETAKWADIFEKQGLPVFIWLVNLINPQTSHC